MVKFICRNIPSAWRFVFVGAAILALSLGGNISVLSFSKSQNHGKFFISQKESILPMPLQVLEICTPQGKRQYSEDFLGSDDWFKNTEFKIKNVSDEDIVFVMFYLGFPDTEATGNMLAVGFNLGKKLDAEITEKQQVITFLKPEQEIIFKIDEAVYERVINSLQKRQPISTIHKLEINFRFVQFKNEVVWSAGQYFKPNPDNPRRYDPIGYMKRPNSIKQN
jgi:hypothetical protein